ncbi:hypothetical protein K2173_007841 [Erythroxylum novogranatense]|uniref:Ubiquitin-like protease family profile domain-containing protein n=1 Tax=Erythroxylum novogranatense TaxID=1862640 RepID=A0AAV8TKW1_9ROSI|nr:hypothetical protein K2173_007841 [Erythroxylum novogranatense]
MGAMTNNRKRDPYSNSNSNSPDFHLSKKLRYSLMHQPLNQTLRSSNSTVSRISRYPETTLNCRREVHAPCRIVKFGSLKSRSSCYSDAERSSGDDMGLFLSKKLDFAKRKAIDAFRYSAKEKEVVDVDDEDRKLGKEVLSEDSSVEEVEIIEENGREGRSRLGVSVVGNDHDNDVKVVEERSVVTVDGNFEVEKARNMMGSLVLNREVDVSSVEVYRKLLQSVERRSTKLSALGFEIKLNEERWSSLKSLRSTKKTEEKLVEEIPREPFIPLTQDEEEELQIAFLASSRRRVLVTHDNSNIDITGELLQCLAPGAWLNDEVINVYLELLKEREKREPQKFLKCHFFSTFFYKKLTAGGNTYDYKAVKRWTTERRLGYFLVDCDKIFIPVHKEIHWCLAIINKKDKKFQYLDSLKGTDSRVLEHLARYYVEEVKDKSRKNIDVSNWEREFLEDLPEQENGYDCGMFMIKYADFFSRGLGLCFGQEHMPYFRKRTAKEILRLRAD